MPANAVSELMMVPIGLQLMLCPPKDEGHIPPVICGSLLRHLPEGAVCCGIRAAERFQSKAEFLNPFEGDKSEEVAVLKYIDAWSRMTSIEQLEYVSSLVGRVLVTDSTPGNISHAHFLAAMVADYVKEKNVVLGPVFPGTPAHIDQILHVKPAPRTQKIAGMRGNTAVKIKKQRHWSAKIGRRINQASVQNRAKGKSLPKARLKPEDEHAVEMVGTEKIRFWTANPGVYEAAALCAEQ